MDNQGIPEKLTIALAGNPNSGKTTIFNNITGTRQKVGNWPGVTVEKKEGTTTRFGYELRIVDLPGTYSLTPFSIEEIVARDFVLESHPDVVVAIIDASNLERSLYLATQLRELDCRVIFALNMADQAKERGIKIDADKLSELLDLPVVFTVGNKNQGIDELLEKTIHLSQSPATASYKRKVKYNKDVENAVASIKDRIDNEWVGEPLPYNSRWTAIKLLEDDDIVKKRVAQRTPGQNTAILEHVSLLRENLRDLFNDDPEIVMTDERYGFIAGIVKEVQTISTRRRVDISRNIDLVLTNRFLGFPIFIFFIWAMFQLTFSVGAYPMNWIEEGVRYLSMHLDQMMPASIFKELLLEGVIAGVGSVIVFLPNILILFFCIAIFEDTGYMARAAFLMDKIMHLIGLHGKSFIPMIMGFGCNVPAIMAARTLESEKDRILTILITPFMSCSARLPVYIVLAGTFFDQQAGTVIFAIYLFGIILSVLTGRLFRLTLLKGEDAPFVMELPPYRVPMLKSLLIHMWDRSKMFLKKMGGVILVGSIIIWGLSSFPRNIDYSVDYSAEIKAIQTRYAPAIEAANGENKRNVENRRDHEINQLLRKKRVEKAEKSLMGTIGKHISFVFTPIGIDWRGGVALVTGFFAKEVVVSTMGILYAVEDEPDALRQALLSSEMTSLGAFSMMIFVLLYVPCYATVAVIRKETGSVKWMLVNIIYSTVLAWMAAFCFYQGGRMIGLQ